jgi:hypothetical protein
MNPGPTIVLRFNLHRIAPDVLGQFAPLRRLLPEPLI